MAGIKDSNYDKDDIERTRENKRLKKQWAEGSKRQQKERKSLEKKELNVNKFQKTFHEGTKNKSMFRLKKRVGFKILWILASRKSRLDMQVVVTPWTWLLNQMLKSIRNKSKRAHFNWNCNHLRTIVRPFTVSRDKSKFSHCNRRQGFPCWNFSNCNTNPLRIIVRY